MLRLFCFSLSWKKKLRQEIYPTIISIKRDNVTCYNLSVSVGFEVAAFSLLGANSKYFMCDGHWSCDQLKDMFGLIIAAAIISLACLAMAFIACLCRG